MLILEVRAHVFEHIAWLKLQIKYWLFGTVGFQFLNLRKN